MPCLCCSLSFCNKKLISVALLYNMWFCGRSLAGLVGSDSAEELSECCGFSGTCPSLSLVQGNPTECGVSECDRGNSPMKKTWPTGGCRAIKNVIDSVCSKLTSASQKYVKFQKNASAKWTRTLASAINERKHGLLRCKAAQKCERYSD
jgi:hypothetical protein